MCEVCDKLEAVIDRYCTAQDHYTIVICWIKISRVLLDNNMRLIPELIADIPIINNELKQIKEGKQLAILLRDEVYQWMDLRDRFEYETCSYKNGGFERALRHLQVK
jgi:hypothetical protein